jgi:hypothetical protein
MASFEKKDFPEISYCITDDYRREIQLTPEQAYELLAWLDQHRDEMFQALHPAIKEMPSWVTPETLAAWKKTRASVEARQRDHPTPDSVSFNLICSAFLPDNLPTIGLRRTSR